MSEWISVKDRLPDNYENVLVVANNLIYIADCWMQEKSLFWEDDDGRILKGVNYWMPLPKPPELDNPFIKTYYRKDGVYEPLEAVIKMKEEIRE